METVGLLRELTLICSHHFSLEFPGAISEFYILASSKDPLHRVALAYPEHILPHWLCLDSLNRDSRARRYLKDHLVPPSPFTDEETEAQGLVPVHTVN